MLWGKGAFGRDYGFFDYAVYSPSGHYKRSNRVSFRLVKMIVDGWRDDDLKKFWTPKTIKNLTIGCGHEFIIDSELIISNFETIEKFRIRKIDSLNK